ncbi:MAG: AAA family ATPase [Oscillospiraceae bacterium]|nr:AAA family ATPase [Candidatus Limimonas egerieequi]
MNIVCSGDTYQIYGDALKTYDRLPVGTYEVRFDKLTGFYLSNHNDLVVTEEKIYGSSPAKVDKVLRGFEVAERNFGVILSGGKGIGKSLFARQLAIKAKEYNLPLIIVGCYVPGIDSFISSIEQEVIVLFDEFEKTFGEHDGNDPQEDMLSLFDGIDGGKKLFIVTCNDTNKLNSCLLNRPGRFHYHLILGNPGSDEIREYMEDNLDVKYHDFIQKIVNFSMSTDLTYDILRAIAFELNMGYSLEETLMDLNINKESVATYTISVLLADGTTFVGKDERLYMYSSSHTSSWLEDARGVNSLRIDFVPSDIVIDVNNSEMTIDPEKVRRYVDEDDFNLNDPKEKAQYESLCDMPIVKISFVKSRKNELLYKYIV